MYMPFFVLHFGIFLHIMAFYLKCKGINSYNLENARLWILLWIHVYEDSEYRTRNIVQYMNSGGNIWIQGAPLSEWVILKPSSDAEFSAAQPGGPDRSMQKNIVPYGSGSSAWQLLRQSGPAYPWFQIRTRPVGQAKHKFGFNVTAAFNPKACLVLAVLASLQLTTLCVDQSQSESDAVRVTSRSSLSSHWQNLRSSGFTRILLRIIPTQPQKHRKLDPPSLTRSPNSWLQVESQSDLKIRKSCQCRTSAWYCLDKTFKSTAPVPGPPPPALARAESNRLPR